MTDKHWKEEVERAIAGSGLPWRVSSTWVEHDGVTYCADVTDIRTGRERRLSIGHREFGTAVERRAEIVRQLTSLEHRVGTVPQPICTQCGAEMRAATQHDPDLNEAMPVWRCRRCGTEVAR